MAQGAGRTPISGIGGARWLPKVQRHLDGKPVIRTVYVPDRLLNFVTS